MLQPDVSDVISLPDVGGRIFNLYINSEDSDKCSLVNKAWYKAVKDAKSTRKLEINVELLKKLKNTNTALRQYIDDRYKYASDVLIKGWSKGTYIQNEIFDSLFDSSLNAKNLIFLSRSKWDSCLCHKAASARGELTNLEFIFISKTSQLSACALLDLISRSPKLRILKFYGILTNPDHHEAFASKIFYSNLERVYWPWTNRKHTPSLAIIAKRNENISTFYSTAATVCDLLAGDNLTNIRFLSVNLNENWAEKSGKNRTKRLLQKINYLSLAKKVEALEVRTFTIEDEDGEEEENTSKEWRIRAETYRNLFWDQVSKFQNLKFLAIYGSWEFEKTCRDIAKRGLKIEYLKINLMPQVLTEASKEGEDHLVLSIASGIRNLRKLASLRSLHYICCEKLSNIDAPTVTALKDSLDIFWAIDIKVNFTEEVEDLISNIIRRGNQTAKAYKLHMLVLGKDPDQANLFCSTALRFPLGSNLREKLNAIADTKTTERFGKNQLNLYQIWGLEQIANPRDRLTFERLTTRWQFYNEKFTHNFEYV